MRENAEKIKQDVEALGLDGRDARLLQKALKGYSSRRFIYILITLIILALSVVAVMLFLRFHSTLASCDMKISDIFNPVAEDQEIEVTVAHIQATMGTYNLFFIGIWILVSIFGLVAMWRDYTRTRIDLKIIEKFKEATSKLDG
ncbi:MAG: hypothetical protein PVH19_07885 [Planctomycetia bacterium]|jgi:hypothetical protein